MSTDPNPPEPIAGEARPPAAVAAESSDRPFPLRLLITGLSVVVIFIGSFSAWASLAPLQSAVVSPGVVGVSSFRKQVQHLEGGIIEQIDVQDGDTVQRGQRLIQLRGLQAEVALRQLELQYFEVLATVARLQAEQAEREQIDYPDELLSRAQELEVAVLIDGQRRVFESRRAVASDELAVMRSRIGQMQQEVGGLYASIETKRSQRELLQEELQTVEKALKKRLVPKSMALKLRRDLAELDGELISYRTLIGKLEQNMLELNLQITERRANRAAEITEALRLRQAGKFELQQEIVASRDVLDRTAIAAPIDGVVVNLQVHSTGGVIRAGESLMEIVPANDELVVEALVSTDDIDEIHVGMPADVRLTSLSRRQRTPIEGVVQKISADRLVDEVSGQAHYRARIAFAPGAVESATVDLVAGMGADVFIRTGERTPLDYLLAPITDSLNQGLREQ